MRKFLGGVLVGCIVSAGIAAAQVHVHGYTRSNGTYVAPHVRSSPNGSAADNWSAKGNVNPYTGDEGTKSVGAPAGGAALVATTPQVVAPPKDNIDAILDAHRAPPQPVAGDACGGLQVALDLVPVKGSPAEHWKPVRLARFEKVDDCLRFATMNDALCSSIGEGYMTCDSSKPPKLARSVCRALQ